MKKNIINNKTFAETLNYCVLYWEFTCLKFLWHKNVVTIKGPMNLKTYSTVFKRSFDIYIYFR